jgi:hypothetical protein
VTALQIAVLIAVGWIGVAVVVALGVGAVVRALGDQDRADFQDRIDHDRCC